MPVIAIIVVLAIAAIAVVLILKPFNSKEPQVMDAGYVPSRWVDHQDIAKIEGYLTQNPEISKKIGTYDWVFTHASVGYNMMNGMKTLHEKDAALYPLKMINADTTPPATLEPGAVYAIDRGNPGAGQKIQLFETFLREQQWGGVVQIAMNKFCYIDPPPYNASISMEENQAIAKQLADEYLASMAKMEGEFPQVQLVYMTMPITSSGKDPNLMRLFFNQEVRKACKEKNAFMLDIADIECYDAENKGNIQAIENGAYPIELMVKAYTDDGGHLSARGQQRIALGWYAVCAAIASEQP